MKEIDLLPEWYKSGKRRQVSYRTQYIALGGVFVMMMVWNFIATHSISKATAELSLLEPKASGAEHSTQAFARIKDEVTGLQKKANILEETVPKSSIKVANILAEISFLIDKKIVLSKVEFKAERFVSKQGEVKVNSSSTVRAARAKFGKERAHSLGDVRFNVMISGVAADASDVAELICKLEDSPYFCLVYPSFSRNKKIKVGTRVERESVQASEFEISCYLANYREK